MMSYSSEAISGGGTRPLYACKLQRSLRRFAPGQKDARQDIRSRNGSAVEVSVGVFTLDEDCAVEGKTSEETL